ncbi:hypothetical protein HELRODRAFT_88577 [Helobdella robusta]|uniref:HID1 domain-containing protein n=1 Tax=Helobdella robusta TaxID=6412 RepID=T1G739_HELRO|nr:hypothetical protein HELRODRAFT_88577 [Helobdella robusta]ESN93547.1 hypothetical protein HELRODRAFT_88577 [Helobdella robusta]
MGNTDAKLNFRKSVVQLTTRTQPVDANDEAFWSQFWSESATCIQDVFTLIPAAEKSPHLNLPKLVTKAVEKLVQVEIRGCNLVRDDKMVQNCIRLLIRILPYIFEDPDWRGFFWSTLPGHKRDDANEPDNSVPLAQSLITSLCDLLFCPDFTVSPNKKSGPDNPEDMSMIDSCEYIWAAGVGFTHNHPATATYEQNRTEILKLLLTCFSETMYIPSHADSLIETNQWISYFTSTDNRHVLPLFTSLLNIVCSYDPVGYGLPYNYLMFNDSREPLVEIALHVLCVTLDSDNNNLNSQSPSDVQFGGSDNLFVNYLSRIHREDDFSFMLKGITRLLNNPLLQTYLPGSCKRIQFHQELLVFLWKICDINKKFMFYVLKSSDVLDILVPILYYLNDARSDQSRVGLMHIGVFILLLLSGERNFGVRLNKPYTVRVPMDIPVFTGSHADLLIIVFHKIITSGHQRLQPLFDCLLTIIVNVSPYLKTLSMVASAKLLHLLEAFSTPWFLFASPSNHHLMFFLLEVFNNIIQYQFDGNSNLVYTIIRKRQIFHQLASLPCDHASIAKALTRLTRKLSKGGPTTQNEEEEPMEGSKPAVTAEPGTLQTSLAATPGIDKMTEKSEAPNMITDQTETNPNSFTSLPTTPANSTRSCATTTNTSEKSKSYKKGGSSSWVASPEWVQSWKQKLPLQTIMRLLQVLVPQVEKICIDKGLTDESEILKFLQHGTLVGLLPVPHPILIRKYQANSGTTMWFRTYMWGIIYLRNVNPPIWYDTDIKLFEIQRV